MRTIAGIFALALLVSACGGGGGGGVVGPELPGPPLSPPPEEEESLALPGLDRIPLSAIKLNNREMQKRFVLLDHGSARWHGENIRETACNAYIIGCDDPEDYRGKIVNSSGVAVVDRTTGSTPYSFFVDEGTDLTDQEYFTWLLNEFKKLGSVKIVTHSISIDTGESLPSRRGATLPFLVVHSAGNEGEDAFPLSAQHPYWSNVQAAIAANKVLYVAGHDRQGNLYVRHVDSSGCKGADAGCLWAPYITEGIGPGTSLSAPRVAAALASVLAVFPDTSHQDLAKFAKACALKRGNGIEALLSKSGGVGVADFTCMGGVMTALANLPSGGNTSTTIDGTSVSLSGREISLSFSGSMMPHVPVNEEETAGFSFAFIPTGEESFVLVGVQRMGELFASVGGGVRGDFFGFSEGHGQVVDSRIEAGHENVFARFSEQRSRGGGLIKSARARSMGFTARTDVSLTEDTTLNLAAHTDRFLGGEATIPFGDVKLQQGGGWNHRLSLSSVSELGRGGTLSFSVDTHLPEMGEERLSLGVQFKQPF